MTNIQYIKLNSLLFFMFNTLMFELTNDKIYVIFSTIFASIYLIKSITQYIKK